jgi:hypothetical protein
LLIIISLYFIAYFPFLSLKIVPSSSNFDSFQFISIIEIFNFFTNSSAKNGFSNKFLKIFNSNSSLKAGISTFHFFDSSSQYSSKISLDSVTNFASHFLIKAFVQAEFILKASQGIANKSLFNSKASLAVIRLPDFSFASIIIIQSDNQAIISFLIGKVKVLPGHQIGKIDNKHHLSSYAILLYKFLFSLG